MAITVRKVNDAIVYALLAAWNGFVKAYTATTSNAHADITSTTSSNYRSPATTAVIVTAANATDLPSVLTLTNQLVSVLAQHAPDANAHKTADATLAAAIAAVVAPTDQASANTALNAIQAAYNAHRTQATVHYTNDATNVSAAAAATTLGTSITLANDLKTQVNAHVQFAPGSFILNATGP